MLLSIFRRQQYEPVLWSRLKIGSQTPSQRRFRFWRARDPSIYHSSPYNLTLRPRSYEVRLLLGGLPKVPRFPFSIGKQDNEEK